MSQPQSASCPDKRRLADDIRTVMNQILNLNKRQLQAAISGDFAEAASLEKELATARQWKDHALDEYKRHVTSHGC